MSTFAKFDDAMQPMAATFVHADKVEAVLFGNSHEDPLWWPSPPVGNWVGYLYFAIGPEQDNAFACRLADLVLDAKSYRAPGQFTKLCEFIPTVGFRVWHGETSVQVTLCFGCHELYVGDEIGGDFDPVTKRLADLTADVFPDWQTRIAEAFKW